MSNFQEEKRLVLDYYRQLDSSGAAAVLNVIGDFTGTDYIWRGYHPFGILTSAEKVATTFWQPFKEAISNLQRRQDIFFAGHNSLGDDGGVWVVSMGHLMGLFDHPWLGATPSHKLIFLRYCEFSHVVDGKIIATTLYIDIPHFMAQAGVVFFPQQTGQQVVQPGPMTHEGLLYEDAPSLLGEKTQALIDAMCDDLSTWGLGMPLEEELARTWHDDMLWWGPTGIGSTYTIERYAKQHSGPFRAAFYDRIFNGHICRVSEGYYGAFFGWPNFTAKHRGGFLGLPSCDKDLDFNVIDVYRRDGDKLAENWVFIDLLWWLKQQDNDVLALMPQNTA